MFNFLRKKEQTSDGLESYEEVAEKKTTSLGYFLILLMAVFLIIVAQTVFSDLKKTVKLPSAPAYCLSSVINVEALKSLSYKQSCAFGEIDREFDLDKKYAAISESVGEIVEINIQISGLNSNLSLTNRKIKEFESQYNLSLQEKIANEQVLYNRSGLQASIKSYRSEADSTSSQISSLASERDRKISNISGALSALGLDYKKAKDRYETDVAWYKVKQFFLMLIFVLPFFVVSTGAYLRLKRKNSPYTIIATGVLMASSLLLMQITLVFLYQILPREWIERIIKFFRATPFMRYVLYYGSVLVLIGVFGGLVYFIQKRVFNPKKVAIRRLKDSKCPGCSFTVNPFLDFCPKCGLVLKEKCPKCGVLKVAHLPFCSACGQRLG